LQHQLDLAAYQHNVHSFEEQVHCFPDAPLLSNAPAR
jgi:hypothetical protein